MHLFCSKPPEVIGYVLDSSVRIVYPVIFSFKNLIVSPVAIQLFHNSDTTFVKYRLMEASAVSNEPFQYIYKSGVSNLFNTPQEAVVQAYALGVLGG